MTPERVALELAICQRRKREQRPRTKMQEISIKEAIEEVEKFKGWLYLGSKPWSLESRGLFYSADLNLSLDDEKKIREELEAKGWRAILSKEDIEDVIGNTEDQIDSPTLGQLFEAFCFFYDNDAYKEW
jgi:hypothetical protein